ncbi:MAG TPA: hypothetical protein VFN26_10180 [Candidatus Acidoferrum sp.]|nr:hypothetical protein [Candidatus Acidoferrum sp.]
MERRKFSDSRSSIGDLRIVGPEIAAAVGSTKMAEATAARSVFGQQDIEQAILAVMSWPQSM